MSTTALKVGGPVAANSCRRGDPLANVYHPYRLQVVRACVTVSGIVRVVRHEDDGDVHFNLDLDQTYAGMLTPGNYNYQDGLLVVEIVPADGPGCSKGQPPQPATETYDYGVCTGADIPTPAVGVHVYVTGPYVIDHVHNWAEIHPAWAVSTSRPTSPAAVPPPTTAPTRAPPSSRGPASTNNAVICQAQMSNGYPSQYSTADVIVKTGVGGANVSATAHYKSTDTTNTGVASPDAVADIPFRVSRAAKGYTVMVSVTVSANSHTASCSTSFTPQ